MKTNGKPTDLEDTQNLQADVDALRRRARENVEKGAVTEGYKANRKAVIHMLNDALATELVCVLRYRRHFYMARGANSEPIAQEFLEHAEEEQSHADALAIRITQLGGEPDLNPDTLTKRSHAQYIEGQGLQDMIKEDLVAERIAIDSYKQMIDFIGNNDPTTRRMLEEILAKEEEHADDLANIMSNKN